MITREIVLTQEKDNYNTVASHVLQSWEWGEFRKKTGVKVIRLGIFNSRGNLLKTCQLTIHPLPHTSYTIGYLPRGPEPDKAMLEALRDIGEAENTIFIKLEPNMERAKFPAFLDNLTYDYPQLRKTPRSLFTKYTFQVDLRKSEEELMSQMKEKTRYNVRVAQRYGVTVKEDNSSEAFKTYLQLTRETTQRQKFYAHSENYHRLMWQTLEPSGIAHLLIASYPKPNTPNPIPLVAWILFTFNNVLYYPYGASSSLYRETMASNLMMWEAIKFGKKMGCHTFDLWGALGPNPNPKDPWCGFHRFKEGYGGKLLEFVGSYDFVLKPALYSLYNLADSLRWKFLRLKSGFR